MNQRLKSLFEEDGEYKERFWTFENVIERLKSIRREKARITGASFKTVTQPDDDQRKILQLLKIKL